MTEQLESYDYEFSYVIDGKVAAVSHLNEFFYKFQLSPQDQLIQMNYKILYYIFLQIHN